MQIEPNVDREAFRQAVSQPVRDTFIKQHGSQLLDAIDALR